MELKSSVLAEGLQSQLRSGVKPSEAGNASVTSKEERRPHWRGQQAVRWGGSSFGFGKSKETAQDRWAGVGITRQSSVFQPLIPVILIPGH